MHAFLVEESAFPLPDAMEAARTSALHSETCNLPSILGGWRLIVGAGLEFLHLDQLLRLREPHRRRERRRGADDHWECPIHDLSFRWLGQNEGTGHAIRDG